MTNKSLYHSLSKMLGLLIMAASATILFSLPARADMDEHKGGYMLTITNNMADELLAPILVVQSRYDEDIFVNSYVTPEAQEQILTGNPEMLAKRIGKNAVVKHGKDGPPGVLLGPGKSVKIPVSGRGAVRVLSMVAPTKFKDHFATAIVNPKSLLPVKLDRYDIGHDEGTRSTTFVKSGVATVTIEMVK